MVGHFSVVQKHCAAATPRAQAVRLGFTFGLPYGLERSRGGAAKRAYRPALHAASNEERASLDAVIPT